MSNAPVQKPLDSSDRWGDISRRFSGAIEHQTELINANPTLGGVLAVIGIVVLVIFGLNGDLWQGIGYLLTVILSGLAVDVWRSTHPSPPRPLPVRNARQETWLILGLAAVALAWLWIRFASTPGDALLDAVVGPAGARVAILFVTPTALVLALLIVGYSPRELGLSFRGWWLGVVIVALFGIGSLLFGRGDLIWQQRLADIGILGLIFYSLFRVGLADEFWRLIAQSRFGVLIASPIWGWFWAALIWTFMHVPAMYGLSNYAPAAFAEALVLLPLGLLYGYISYRTRSFVPAAIAHAFNLWGLEML